MVNVIGRTKEEIEQMKKDADEKNTLNNLLDDLIGLAKENFPFNIEVYQTTKGFATVNHAIADPMFETYIKENLIVLYKEKYFNKTLGLANAYEELTGKDWTLKRNYDE